MQYKALIINCMDPRLQGENLIRIASAAELSSGEYETLTYGGPSLWCTDPHTPTDKDSLLWLMRNISLDVHGVSRVVLVGHSNCGGFALKGAPKDPVAERRVIEASLKDAIVALESQFPGLEVVPVFVTIGDTQAEGLLPEILPERLNLVQLAVA